MKVIDGRLRPLDPGPPGCQSSLTGIFLTGDAGDAPDGMLRTPGMSRREIYITMGGEETRPQKNPHALPNGKGTIMTNYDN